MNTEGQEIKVGLKGGPFFYIFYLGYFFIVMTLLYLGTNYMMTGEVNRRLLSQAIVIFISFLVAFWKFKKGREKLIEAILGSEEEGVRCALENPKLRRKTEQAVGLAIQFGVKRGVKKLEKLLQYVESYDDKAVLYYVEGVLYETAGNNQSALHNYNRALQCRPFYSIASDKVEEMNKSL